MFTFGLRCRAFLRRDDGQSILEVAAAAPFLVLMLVGAFEFGRYMYDGIEVGNAARAATQYGAQSTTFASDYPGIRTAAFRDAPQINLVDADVTPRSYCTCDSSQGTEIACGGTSPCSANDRRDFFIEAKVTKAFNPLIVVPGLPNPLTITKIETQEISP